MARTPTIPAPAPEQGAGALTADELKLLVELKARVARHGAPDTIDRELSTRELVLAGALRDRDHFDGCPAIDDIRKGAARTEAYGDVRPPDPARGLGPRPLTVVRCVECGGARYFDGEGGAPQYDRPDDLIVAELERRAGHTDPATLDTSL